MALIDGTAGWSPRRTIWFVVPGVARGDDGNATSARQREGCKLMHELLLFSSDGVMPGAAIRTEIPPVDFPGRVADQARNEKSLTRRDDALPASLPW